MFEMIKSRMVHGYQAIPDPLTTSIDPAFPGLPRISVSAPLARIAEICPVNAISFAGLDLGKCTFCGACERAYPEDIRFMPDFRMGADSREKLIIRAGQENWLKDAIQKRLPRQFRRSFALRNVSAGGCNACELELGACSNVNFDMGRYGIEVVASPRHADAVIISGPITENMLDALIDTFEAVSAPRFIILCGSCAISGGSFNLCEHISRGWLQDQIPILFIPGCPAHPLTIIHAIHTLMRGR